MTETYELLGAEDVRSLEQVVRAGEDQAGTPAELATLACNLLMEASTNEAARLYERAKLTLARLEAIPVRCLHSCSAQYDKLNQVAASLALADLDAGGDDDDGR